MIDKKSKIKEFINKSQSNEFTFDDIYKSIYSRRLLSYIRNLFRINNDYIFEIAEITAKLVIEGFLDLFIRVELPFGTKDFANIFEVPNTIYDPTGNITFYVTPDDLHVMYRKHISE